MASTQQVIAQEWLKKHLTKLQPGRTDKDNGIAHFAFHYETQEAQCAHESKRENRNELWEKLTVATGLDRMQIYREVQLAYQGSGPTGKAEEYVTEYAVMVPPHITAYFSNLLGIDPAPPGRSH